MPTFSLVVECHHLPSATLGPNYSHCIKSSRLPNSSVATVPTLQRRVVIELFKYADSSHKLLSQNIGEKYVIQELPYVQAGFRKHRGIRDQITNILWLIIQKARGFQKNIYYCFIHYAKAFDCVDHKKPRKILQKMGIPEHLTCLLRNLYVGQEAADRTLHGTTNWYKIGQ